MLSTIMSQRAAVSRKQRRTARRLAPVFRSHGAASVVAAAVASLFCVVTTLAPAHAQSPVPAAPPAASAASSVDAVLAEANKLLRAGKLQEGMNLLTDKRKQLSVGGSDADKRTIAVAIADIHFQVAMALQRENRLDEAIMQFEEAYEIDKTYRIKDSGADLNGIAAAYNRLGKFDKALEFYGQALPVRRQAKDIGGEAITLNGMGVVYAGLRQTDKALSFFEQALPLRRQAKDVGGEALTLASIASVYAGTNQREKALAHFKQALALYQQLKDAAGEARMQDSIRRLEELK